MERMVATDSEKTRRNLEKVKYHLESLGFFVNDGIKYGLNFLAYTDSPDRVHSKYGVIVTDQLLLYQVVAYQRICTSNNKILLVAIVSGDDIKYYECRRFPESENLNVSHEMEEGTL